MDYRIWWYANYDLCADKVELRDTIYYDLELGNYDVQIGDIVTYWNDYPALEYFYLWDEPQLDQFEAFYRVKHEMGGDGKPITCVSPRYKNDYKYNHYTDFIKTCYADDNNTPLLVDEYALSPDDTTPETIQGKFNYLCAWMDAVREIADTTGPGNPSRDIWYICQAHSWIKDNGDTVWRDPTPEEMWALAGLGFAHGAKGIWYFRYMSRYYGSQSPPDPDSMYIHGLVDWNPDSSDWVHNKKWDATQDVNAVLQVIDTFLLDFAFQKAFKGDSLQDYIKYISLGGLSEFGLFEDSVGLKYFLIVNRTDDYDTTAPYPPEDSTLVTLGLDGYLYGDSYYIRDCYSGEPYKYDSTGGEPEALTLYFKFYLKDCHFKLFQLVPFTCDIEINSDSSYTDYRFAKIDFDTSISLSDIDILRMTVWDNEGDTINDVLFDSEIIWEFDAPGTKVISASFEIISDNYIQGDSGYLTPTYCDTIYFDTIPPSSNSIDVVDTLEGFVNQDSVDLELSSTDTGSPVPVVRKMRFSNYGFSNLLQNADFSASGGAHWTCVDSAWVDSGYGEISGIHGGKIYQDVGDSLFADNELYHLSVYVVTDSFLSQGAKVSVKYRYLDSLSNPRDTIALSMDISSGDNAFTGYNCMSDTFTYNPPIGTGDSMLGCRVEVYQGSPGTGWLIVDEFLFERDYTESAWHDYDTTYSNWGLTSGNGEKAVWAEYRDAAGNITSPVSDTVILNATDPIGNISSPHDRQVISGTVAVKGWAHDSAEAVQHFQWYMVEYKPTSSGDWNPVDTFAYYDTAVYCPPFGQPDTLAVWPTLGLSDGNYYLRLIVEDSAVNADTTQITVNVNNFGKRGSGEFNAGKEPAGIGSFSDLYITDVDQGNLLKHKETGDSIGYCELEKDSLGLGEPCAIATDSVGFWIADRYNHTVIYYEYDGDPKYKIGGFGEDKGEFNEPSGIALWDKKVYVTDRYNHRVQVFKEDEYLFEFGSKGDSAGQFIEPLGITIDKYGWVYVVDRGNNRIQAFDTAGTFIEIFAKDIEFKNPCGIAADTFGYIFVVDQENFRVVELDPFGDPICEFGEKGNEEGQFLEPFDVAISEDGEKLFVTDKNLKKVVKFNICIEDSGGPMSIGDGEIPIINCLKACYPVPFSKGVNVSYSIANKGHVSIKVYDVTGRLIKKLVHGTQDRGLFTIGWDGHNQNAKTVAAGVYFIRMETGSFLSTRKVLLVK